MQIRVIAVGKIKEGYLTKGILEYSKRLRRYGKFQIVEIKEEPFNEPLSDKELELVLKKEGERIITKLSPRAYICALDRVGQAITSEQLAERFTSLAVAGTNQIDFIIGGSLGLHSQVLDAAHFRLSFSQLTFPHQLMRLILIEQIYRAFTIAGGERYHK